MLGCIWTRFLILGPLGKTATVIAVLYGSGWVAGALGWHALARQFGTAALAVLAALLTMLVLRWAWNSYTGKPGR